MPELPEVETVVRQLKSRIIGRSISGVELFFSKIADEGFADRVRGELLADIYRRGKFIVFKMTDLFMIVHLRMTGKFFIRKKDQEKGRHEHLRLYLDNQEVLCYEDVRKFGRWYLRSDPGALLNKLGLEPLSSEFTQENFAKLFSGNKVVKAFLLDQSKVAGIGNIYADEALFLAKIHPETPLSKITIAQKKALHMAIRDVLQKGIENGGTTFDSYQSLDGKKGENISNLNVFRRTNKPCFICGSPIKKIKLAQRSTHFCPVCQKNNC